MWQQWINFILGLWVIISAYINFATTSLRTNLTVTGIVIAVLAIWGALEHQQMGERQTGAGGSPRRTGAAA